MRLAVDDALAETKKEAPKVLRTLTTARPKRPPSLQPGALSYDRRCRHPEWLSGAVVSNTT